MATKNAQEHGSHEHTEAVFMGGILLWYHLVIL
jgi:hypothetical protein